MKKMLLNILLASMVIVMFGCGTNTKTGAVDKTKKEETVKKKPNIADDEKAEMDHTESKVQTTGVPDFRNAHWGEDKETVKKNHEGGTYLGETDDGQIQYGDVNVAGNKAIAFYNFDNDGKLYHAGYTFEDMGNGNVYLNLYDKLKKGLKKKYGEPRDEKDERKLIASEDQIASCANEGEALELGYLAYDCTWRFDDIYIDLLCSTNSETFITHVFLEYSDTNSKQYEMDDMEGL
jgi:hypothetical protein